MSISFWSVGRRLDDVDATRAVIPRRKSTLITACALALLIAVGTAGAANPQPPPPPPPPPPSGYFSTLSSGVSGLPKADGTCALLLTTSTWDPRPDNQAANHNVPADPSAVPWSNAEIGSYWAKWIAKRNQVTGNETGTTNQILQWAACKWGMDEDLLRAVAVQESDWHESMVGDNCGPVGQASYGILQIKNAYCNGGGAWGGYPYTAQDTALNADFYAAYLRSCLDGDFSDHRRQRPRLRGLGLRRLLVLGRLVRLRRPELHQRRQGPPREQGLARVLTS